MMQSRLRDLFVKGSIKIPEENFDDTYYVKVSNWKQSNDLQYQVNDITRDITGTENAIPIFTAGVAGGTLGGRAIGSGVSRALVRILPAHTRYKMPKLPSAGQVIFSPVVAPFKIGEMFGTA
jgi:hypothetical protein